MPAPNYRMIRANKSAGTGKGISALSYSRACLSKASLQLCTPQRVLCNILFAYAYYTRHIAEASSFYLILSQTSFTASFLTSWNTRRSASLSHSFLLTSSSVISAILSKDCILYCLLFFIVLFPPFSQSFIPSSCFITDNIVLHASIIAFATFGSTSPLSSMLDILFKVLFM